MEKIKYPGLSNFIVKHEARSTNPEVIGKEIKQLLRHNKVVNLTLGMHITNLESFYNGVSEELGTPIDIAEDYVKAGARTGERWMEVRYDNDIPDIAAYRHSKNGQPLHTDESYSNNPCDVMIFYCQNKAPIGGQTIFVDGLALVERMKVVDPTLLELLTSTEICYEKSTSKRKEKIIDMSQELPIFNYNYTCISPNESEVNKRLNQRFSDFLATHIRGSFLEIAVDLNPGESVYWWDHSVLHGRNPFEAFKTNDRFIWKTGIKWNE